MPLAQAQAFGDAVLVSYDKDTIKGARHIDADQQLSEHVEEQLYGCHGLT